MWSWGDISVTWPFATLTLNGSTVVLKAAWKRFVFTPDRVAEAYPTRGGARTGLGILTPGGRVLVFWTSREHAILTALEAAGFPTSNEVRGIYG
jgi:hypothetical protein